MFFYFWVGLIAIFVLSVPIAAFIDKRSSGGRNDAAAGVVDEVHADEDVMAGDADADEVQEMDASQFGEAVAEEEADPFALGNDFSNAGFGDEDFK